MKATTLDDMDQQIAVWNASRDPRWIFLSCYRAMTANVLESVHTGDFHDPPWVERLLHRFADYYFAAVRSFEEGSPSTAPVWTVAFEHTMRPEARPLQRLFLGVNAHINYDLVLTLVDVLKDEWDTLDVLGIGLRKADHEHVNDVIASTIDEVQDDILEREAPSLDLLDKGLGRVDEFLIAKLISHWRDRVWTDATRMLEKKDEREAVLAMVNDHAVARAKALTHAHWYLRPDLLL